MGGVRLAEVEAEHELVKDAGIDDWSKEMDDEEADVEEIDLEVEEGDEPLLAAVQRLPTLRPLSRVQYDVSPSLFKKETLPSLFTVVQATCRPSSVLKISTFTVGWSPL